jgi:ribosomal protein RSM22 (predicted rRNA methylase)
MHWTREQIEEFLIKRPSDQKVANLLNQIKTKYLEEKGESIALSEEEVSAYTQFYMPTNSRKFEFIWQQLDLKIKEEMITLPIVDFGCGPGTYLWAAASVGFRGPFYGVDSSAPMLKQAKALGKGLFPDLNFDFTVTDKDIPFDDPKTLLFGNAVNELGVSQTLKIIERINPKFIILIEPGTSKVFKEILKLRSGLKDRTFEVHYPCASLKHSCPVEGRIKDEREDWCHQVLREVPHPSIERIGQMARMDRKVQPYIGHVYEFEGRNSRDDLTARFVRFLTESKFAFNWEVCLVNDGEQSIFEFEIPKKVLDKKTQKLFKKISIGHEMTYSVLKILKDDKMRVKVELKGLDGN